MNITITYKWENEALEKYGKEATQFLIEMQKRYESKKQDNDCNSCGKNNHGSLIEAENGKPFILHFTSCGKHCDTCGKKQR